MSNTDTPKQLLHLVFGGELESPEGLTFRDLDELDIVGFVPTVWQTIYLLRPLDRPASKIAREFSDMLAARIEALVSEGMSAPEG